MQENFPPEECPECGSTNVVYSKIREEIICDDCGCVYPRIAGEVIAEKPAKKKRKAGKVSGRKAKKGKKRK